MSEEPRPYTLVAELTYRCPLRCVYCSNPTDWNRHADALTTDDWLRVFREAEALGVVQLNLTGGEPLLRDDLEQLVEGARRLDLYLAEVIEREEFERRRKEVTQTQHGLTQQLRQLDAQAQQHVNVAALAQGIAVFCQRIQPTLDNGRRFQLGEGWHSNENAVHFWNSSPRIPKETHSRCYASATAYVMMIPPCNSCSVRSKKPLRWHSSSWPCGR